MTIDLQPALTRLLGTTGMEITRVGLGAWAIGGANWSFGWSIQDDNESIAAIRRAIEAGINWVDTAAVYGLGHSEQIVARALSDFTVSDRPYVFTKCGFVWDEQHPTALPQFIGNPTSIRREVEDSLRRLAVERIDLYQMHWPPKDGTPIEEYWGALLDLKREGKIRAAGLSNHSLPQLEIAERIGHVDSLQPPLSAICRDAGRDELPWCAQHNIGVIVYSPMQSGLLSGSFSAERAAILPSDDWRSRSDYFSGDALQRNLQLADALRPVAQRHGTTVAAVAVAWTLAWPGVTGAIVGARRPQQVDGWLDAMRIELASDDLCEIAMAIEHVGAGSGPARPKSLIY
jgi:aryl-alcohol dehydrogenase-like predicted oxidoreductase